MVPDSVLYAIFAVLLRWTLMSISHCLAQAIRTVMLVYFVRYVLLGQQRTCAQRQAGYRSVPCCAFGRR